VALLALPVHFLDRAHPLHAPRHSWIRQRPGLEQSVPPTRLPTLSTATAPQQSAQASR